MDIDTLADLLIENCTNENLLLDLIKTYSEILNCPLTSPWKHIIIRAARHGHQILVSQLIKSQKVDLNVTDSQKNTALICAVWYNFPEISIELIKAGANIHLTDSTHKNALSYIDRIMDIESRNKVKALLTETKPQITYEPKQCLISAIQLEKLLSCYSNNASVVAALISKHKAIINESVSGWSSLLTMAVINQYEIVALELIKNKIDVNRKSTLGNTALMIAIARNLPTIAINLIDADTDITIKNNDGKTAFDYLGDIVDETKRKEIRDKLEAKIPKAENPIEETKPVETQKPVESFNAEESRLCDLIYWMISNGINFTYTDGKLQPASDPKSKALAKEPTDKIKSLVFSLINKKTNFTFIDGKFSIDI